jgi:predicted ABC-type ATPase
VSAPDSLIVVIAGPNGAGKSTTGPRLLQGALAVSEFVNADTIAQGLSAFRPESVAVAAGRVMLSRLRALAEARADFAFETTLAGRNFARWLDTLRGSGYRVHIAFLSLPSPELAVQRVAERVRLGGHAVPDDVIRRRFTAGLRSFFTLYQPVADTWQMFDNSELGVPRLIASGDAGLTIQILDSNAWDALLEAGR